MRFSYSSSVMMPFSMSKSTRAECMSSKRSISSKGSRSIFAFFMLFTTHHAFCLLDAHPTTVIAETRGLPDETRVKLIEATKEERKEKPSQVAIRKAVRVAKEADERVRNDFLKGELTLDKAVEMTEVAKKAPEPLRQAIAKKEIEPEVAKKAVKLYEELKHEGVELDPNKVSLHVEELKKE